MLTFPLNNRYNSISEQLIRPESQTIGSTGAMKRAIFGVSYFIFKLNFTAGVTLAEKQNLRAFFLNLKESGSNNLCLLPLPSQFDSIGSNSNNLSVVGRCCQW